MRISGKKPTKAQCIFIDARGYDHREWLVVSDRNDVMIIRNRKDQSLVKFDKDDWR